MGYWRCKKTRSSARSIQGYVLLRGYVSCRYHLYLVSIVISLSISFTKNWHFPIWLLINKFIFYYSLQAFAIPGSLFLSILSGFLFQFHIALTLVCICSAVGASLCYLLSQLVGRRLVRHFFPERAQKWSEQVDKHRNDLLSYILFLRMTPLLPNWFINLVAPVIGVPLYPFALGTFLGKFSCLFFFKFN